MTKAYGEVRLRQPIAMWIVAIASAGMASTVILFIIFATYTSKVTAMGELVPASGLGRVTVPVAGTIDLITVNEGDRVRKGDRLALIVSAHSTLSGDSRGAIDDVIRRERENVNQLLQARTKQMELLGLSLQKQIATARLEVSRLKDELAIGTRQVELSERNLQRVRLLADENLVSASELNAREADLLSIRASRQQIERQRLEKERAIDALELQRQELPSRRQQEIVDSARSLASLDQQSVLNAANGEWLVSAPVSGIVAAQLAFLGQTVREGALLLTILPDQATLHVHLFVPGAAAGFIRPGNRVKLRYHAFPYQKFGHHSGEIIQVSRTALSAAEVGANGQEAVSGQSFYRAVVRLEQQLVRAYGRDEFLRPGMTLEADIQMENRSLIEWALEPLYSIRGRLFN
jgi:membrane fusion protein